MWALYKKEISSFLNSLIGYIVIIVFLFFNGLFIWIIEGNMNVLDSGYATLDGLFMLAPWLFMFLIPAITMRMISEEKRNRTLEFLLTKPLTDFHVVMSKFLAGLTLVMVALLPTLVYYVTLYYLGETVGNIDRGGTLGSYVGLIFLAAAYVSMGLFSSSLTENQIVSFLLGVVFCFFMYTGWESLSSFDLLGGLDSFVNSIGSLTETTIETITNLDDQIFFKVYLTGDLPSEYKKLEKAIKEKLDEFRDYSDDLIDYEFVNPYVSEDMKENQRFWSKLFDAGVKLTRRELQDDDAQKEKFIFNGALMNINGVDYPVKFRIRTYF